MPHAPQRQGPQEFLSLLVHVAVREELTDLRIGLEQAIIEQPCRGVGDLGHLEPGDPDQPDLLASHGVLLPRRYSRVAVNMPVAFIGRFSSAGSEARNPVAATWNRPRMTLSVAEVMIR